MFPGSLSQEGEKFMDTSRTTSFPLPKTALSWNG